MGLTYEQAKSLGLGHLHPAACGVRSPERALLDQVDANEPTVSEYVADKLTKLERRFRDEVLKPGWARGDIDEFWYESIKFRLGGHLYYIPDWTVALRDDPRTVIVETKGYMREDARIKLKVAAGMYPCFRWLLVERPMRAWEVREVTGNGIGRDPVRVAWI